MILMQRIEVVQHQKHEYIRPPSQSTSKAKWQYAGKSMISGGGSTNLSGSGSTAMDKLLADQQAQT